MKCFLKAPRDVRLRGAWAGFTAAGPCCVRARSTNGPLFAADDFLHWAQHRAKAVFALNWFAPVEQGSEPERLAMNASSGQLAMIALLGLVLSWACAWWCARHYAASLRKLMTAPASAARAKVPDAGAPQADARPRLGPQNRLTPLAPSTRPRASVASNHQASMRLLGWVVGLSGLIAASSAALQLALVMNLTLSPGRWAALTMVYLWPVVVCVGLPWCWGSWRIFGVLMLWFVLSVALLVWRSEGSTALMVSFAATEVFVPAALVALVCLGPATRAVAPWLLPAVSGLGRGFCRGPGRIAARHAG
jgi:hypothetical protein